MAIYSQTIKGKSVKFSEIIATDADLTDLEGLLEGKVTKFDLKSTGGSVSAYPAVINRKKFSCGDKGTSVSCSFTVPHCKATAYTPDFEAVVIGAFDASFDSSVKSDYTNLLYDRN